MKTLCKWVRVGKPQTAWCLLRRRTGRATHTTAHNATDTYPAEPVSYSLCPRLSLLLGVHVVVPHLLAVGPVRLRRAVRGRVLARLVRVLHLHVLALRRVLLLLHQGRGRDGHDTVDVYADFQFNLLRFSFGGWLNVSYVPLSYYCA